MILQRVINDISTLLPIFPRNAALRSDLALLCFVEIGTQIELELELTATPLFQSA